VDGTERLGEVLGIDVGAETQLRVIRACNRLVEIGHSADRCERAETLAVHDVEVVLDLEHRRLVKRPRREIRGSAAARSDGRTLLDGTRDDALDSIALAHRRHRADVNRLQAATDAQFARLLHECVDELVVDVGVHIEPFC